MEPNYKLAAEKAAETLSRFGIDSDPLSVIEALPNVISFSFSFVSDNEVFSIDNNNLDAFTLVSWESGSLRYMIIYNDSLPAYRVRLALARELGHVILRHDGSCPEDIWSEEANCFAYHFLCPTPKEKEVCVVYYRPQRHSISAEFKEMRSFTSVDALKEYIAEEHNKFCRYIGVDKQYTLYDVEIRANDRQDLGGWKNYSSVVLDGRTLGYYGE